MPQSSKIPDCFDREADFCIGYLWDGWYTHPEKRTTDLPAFPVKYTNNGLKKTNRTSMRDGLNALSCMGSILIAAHARQVPDLQIDNLDNLDPYLPYGMLCRNCIVQIHPGKHCPRSWQVVQLPLNPET